MYRRSSLEMRVLILAPVGRDASLLAGTLASQQVDTTIAGNDASLEAMLEEGAGCCIIAEEALSRQGMTILKSWLSEQPSWSDLPFIVLTFSGAPTRQSQRRVHEIEELGNFVLIERPARPDTIHSAVRTALRARMRQYEIRARQEALIQANADLEQFAHAASHDLREPLRSIGIYSDLLARGYADKLDERGNKYLSQIHTGAVRMDTLLRDLLAYSQASSIGADQFEPTPAQRSLQTALENLAGAIEESNAHIDAEELPTVAIRESHLSQVFQNLLGNAIKYRREDVPPVIRLFVRQEQSHWIFTVSDNGIGIPDA